MDQAAIRETLTPIPGTITYSESDNDHLIYNGNVWQRLRGRDIRHCIQTVSGTFMWPLEPHEDEIHMEDIAHGLACEYRYANHSPYPYSVAWHSVALSHVVPDHLKKYALLHDAAEAYIKDMPRPIRTQKPFDTAYEEIDDRLTKVICSRFNIEKQQKELLPYDIRMGHSEMAVWAEGNSIYLAKLYAVKVDLMDAYHSESIKWVRKCPQHDHWQKAKVVWQQRYEELFNHDSSQDSHRR